MQDPRLETAVLGLHILAAACWFAPRLWVEGLHVLNRD